MIQRANGNNSATFSTDSKQRFLLKRIWDVDRKAVHVILCNPGVADHIRSEPAVDILQKRLGCMYGGIFVTGLYSLISASPIKLDCFKHSTETTNHFIQIYSTMFDTICAWGMSGQYIERKQVVLRLLKDKTLYTFGQMKDGTPKQPFYGKELRLYETQV